MQRIKPNCAGEYDVLSTKIANIGDFPHALYPLSIWIDFSIRTYGVLSTTDFFFIFSIFLVELMDGNMISSELFALSSDSLIIAVMCEMCQAPYQSHNWCQL